MSELRGALVVVLMLLTFVRANAAIRPSFMLEHCAWHATEIVVASEGQAIDGTLNVLAVWDGELAVGDSVSIPELSRFSSEESRTVRPYFDDIRDKTPPLVLSSQRMVLFLKRGENQLAHGKAVTDTEWKPASLYGGMNVSVAWLAEDKVYAFTQVMNPGPSILGYQRYSEEELQRRITDIVKTRNELRAINGLTDISLKATEAVKYTDSPIYYAREEAFRVLGDAGADALPHLRGILRDSEKLRLHDEAINALGSAGGESVVPELTAIVEEELAFWKKTAPELKQGWWNGKGLEWNQVDPLRDRYSVVLEVFYTLRKIRSPASRTSVQNFRDFWRSLPQLEDKSGLNQMSEACDKVLKALPRGGEESE